MITVLKEDFHIKEIKYGLYYAKLQKIEIRKNRKTIQIT